MRHTWECEGLGQSSILRSSHLQVVAPEVAGGLVEQAHRGDQLLGGPPQLGQLREVAGLDLRALQLRRHGVHLRASEALVAAQAVAAICNLNAAMYR